MSLSFVALGDIHADKLTDLLGDAAHDLMYGEWCKAADYAINNGIKHLFQLGDVSNAPRLSEEARIALLKFMFKYDGRLEMDWVLGNHDVEHEGFHSLQAFAELCSQQTFKTTRVHVVASQRKIGGVTVDFLPFPHKKALKGGNKQHLCLAHLERPGAERDNGMRIDSDSGVPQKDDHQWVVGHLHTHQKLGRTWFTGTAYQTNFGESLPKGFTVGKASQLTNGKLKVELEFIKTSPKFVLHNLKVETLKDFDKIKDDPLHLYKVTIARGLKVDFDVPTRYPNVVNNPSTYANAAESKVALEASPTHDIKTGLGKDLRDRGFDKRMVKRGIKIVDSILSNLQTP